MADVDRIAAALRYQQEMDAAQRPATMNPNIAAQGAAGRALVAPPTSVMDERYPAWKKSQDDAENLINAADMIGAAIPLAGPAVKGAVALGRYAGPELARGLEQHMVRMGGIMPLDVYHGTPHRFPPTANNPLGEFDPMKIGTGEGAQAYGHGLYLAENPAVSNEYATKLSSPIINFSSNNKLSAESEKAAKWIRDNVEVMQSNARQGEANRLFNLLPANIQNELGKPSLPNVGNLYKVDLPDEHIAKMLDWDKPLSEQTPYVQKIMNEEIKRIGGSASTGERAYKELMFDARMQGNKSASPAMRSNEEAIAASNRLRELGIPGIRYLDQGSRAGGGTSNFVVFDPKHMNIIGRE